MFFFASPALTATDEGKTTGAKVSMEEVVEFLTGFESKNKNKYDRERKTGILSLLKENMC